MLILLIMFLQRDYLAFSLRMTRNIKGGIPSHCSISKRYYCRTWWLWEIYGNQWPKWRWKALFPILSSSKTIFSSLVQTGIPQGLRTPAVRSVPGTYHLIVGVKTEGIKAFPGVSAPKTQWKCHHTFMYSHHDFFFVRCF